MGKHSAASALTLVIGTSVLISMPVRADWYADARPMMGTEVSVRLWHEDAATGQQLVAAVMVVLLIAFVISALSTSKGPTMCPEVLIMSSARPTNQK